MRSTQKNITLTNQTTHTYTRQQEISTAKQCLCLKSNDCVIDNHIYQLQFYICITGFVSRAVWILCNVYFPVLEVTHVLVCLQLRDVFSCECFPYFNFQDMLSLKSDFLVSHLLWIILSTHMFSRFALYFISFCNVSFRRAFSDCVCLSF